MGTDHGYIPIALFERGYTGYIGASDINPGPLQSAVRNAAECGAEDAIDFILCDGLDGCDPRRFDTVVIAGMGGDTICGILDRAEWCTDPGYTFLLQPMTKAEVLRFWLIHNGFVICDEKYIPDGNVYQFMICRAGASAPYSDAELYTGKFEQVRDDPLFPDYLGGLIDRFRYMDASMSRAESRRDDARLALTREILDELVEMRDKLEKR